MLLKIKLLMATLAVSVIPALVLAPTVAADNPAINAIQNGACSAGSISNAECETKAKQSGSTLNSFLHRVINIFSVIGGIVAVIMIVAAGFRYITSSGNEQATAGAKRTLLYAVIGLVIIALAQLIAKFALNTAARK